MLCQRSNIYAKVYFYLLAIFNNSTLTATAKEVML